MKVSWKDMLANEGFVIVFLKVDCIGLGRLVMITSYCMSLFFRSRSLVPDNTKHIFSHQQTPIHFMTMNM